MSLGRGGRILKKNCPGRKWPDDLPYLRCSVTLTCSAGVPLQDKHDFPRHYQHYHPGVVYDFEKLIRCTYKEQVEHIDHQKSLGLARNYGVSRRTTVPKPKPAPQTLAASTPPANQPLAQLAPHIPLAPTSALDTAPPSPSITPPVIWECTLCAVPVGGVWGAIEHSAGHDYPEVHYDAGVMSIYTVLDEGEMVDELHLIREDAAGKIWLLVSRML